jgi:hypothetical protein
VPERPNPLHVAGFRGSGLRTLAIWVPEPDNYIIWLQVRVRNQIINSYLVTGTGTVPDKNNYLVPVPVTGIWLSVYNQIT